MAKAISISSKSHKKTLYDEITSTPIQHIINRYEEELTLYKAEVTAPNYSTEYTNIINESSLGDNTIFFTGILSDSSIYRYRAQTQESYPYPRNLVIFCAVHGASFRSSVRFMFAFGYQLNNAIPISTFFLRILYHIDKLPSDVYQRREAVEKLLKEGKKKGYI